MTATQTAAETFAMNFAMTSCRRCDGKGYMNGYSHVAGGVCFACNGDKRKMTTAGQAAYDAYRAMLAQVNGVKVTELAEGDRIVSRANGRGMVQYGEAVRTIAAIRRNSDVRNFPPIRIEFTGEVRKTISLDEDATVLRFDPEAAREVAREIARQYPSGLTVIEG